MRDLEDVLNGTEESEPVEPVETVLTETATDDLKAEPEEAPAVEEEATPTVAETEIDQGSNEVAAFKAKAIDETSKRQAMAADNEALRQQLQALQQPQQPKADFWDNPDNALDGMTKNFDEKIRQVEVNTTARIMRSMHDDYTEMETLFIDLGQKSPVLFNQMNQSDNPAKFAYDYAKNHTEMESIGDPADYKARIRAEVEAEYAVKTKSDIEAAIKTRSDLPGSLSNERASGGNTNPTQARPQLEGLIGN